MKSFFKDLPPLVRGIIILVILAVIIFVLWKIYQYFKEKAENKPNTIVVSDAQKEIAKSTVPPSFSDADYQGTANAIAKLLDGCETDESEAQVVEEVKKSVKSAVDWYKLVVAFGTRDIADCGSFGISSTNYDLVSLLKDQLDTTQVFQSGTFQESKDILSKYLQTIGINF